MTYAAAPTDVRRFRKRTGALRLARLLIDEFTAASNSI
jgi:hypothetical protein